MKKVLMLGPGRKVHGGISGVVNNLYSAGLDQKAEIKYISTMEEGSKMHKLFVAMHAYLSFLSLLKWADIVHVNASSDSSFLRKSIFVKRAFKAKKRIVFHQHGGDIINYYENEISSRRKKYIRRILDMADVLIVLSPLYRDFFGELTDKDKIIILPNTISIPGIDKEELFYGKDYKKILFLGRICKSKGISELLKAMEGIFIEFPEVTLYLGGIYEDEEYKEIIENADGRIKYIGWISGREKDKYLKECGIFVLPTYFEGQPVSVLEAMSYGMTVVASKVGGIPMMIKDGKSGILTEAKDADSLKEGLRRVLSDKEYCVLLGREGRKTIEEEYDINNTVDHLSGVYDSF